MFGSLFRKKALGLDARLQELADCGVKLLPGATAQALLEDWSLEQFEGDPYGLLLTALGSDERALSTNLWHFDTECIQDHGDYVRIGERLRTLAGNDLPLTDIDDFVDVEAGEAWISFKLDGTDYRWTCEVDDDWVDPAILSQFARLLVSRDAGRRFTYLSFGGQDCVLGCFSNVELKQLKKITGLAWEWLT